MTPRNAQRRGSFKRTIAAIVEAKAREGKQANLLKIAIRLGCSPGFVYMLYRELMLEGTVGPLADDDDFDVPADLRQRIATVRQAKQKAGPKYWRGRLTLCEETLRRLLP